MPAYNVSYVVRDRAGKVTESGVVRNWNTGATLEEAERIVRHRTAELREIPEERVHTIARPIRQ